MENFFQEMVVISKHLKKKTFSYKNTHRIKKGSLTMKNICDIRFWKEEECKAKIEKRF